MSDFELRSARYLASDHLSRTVKPGDTVVDATMGNGHDTCFLAELVGEAGRVIAFDLQQVAVDSTSARLAEAGLRDRCELYCLGHEHMREKVSSPVRAVAFNLGWLPGGDKQITTRWETTKAALEQALALLLPLGICTVCAYPGHEAGDVERRQLTEFLSSLRPQEFNVLHQKFLNAGPNAPECFVIQRMQD